MKKRSKGETVSIIVLILLSAFLAVSMYRQEKTVLMVLWTTVAILHMIRLGILVWKNTENRKSDREE